MIDPDPDAKHHKKFGACCTFIFLYSVFYMPIGWVFYTEGVLFLDRSGTHGGEFLFASTIIFTIVLCCFCCMVPLLLCSLGGYAEAMGEEHKRNIELNYF